MTLPIKTAKYKIIHPQWSGRVMGDLVSGAIILGLLFNFIEGMTL